jgi:zinc protease
MMRITNYELRITNFVRRLSVSVFVLCLAFISVDAQEQTPKPGAPREAQIPQPVEKTLRNGLRVIVVQTKNVPLVTAELMIKSGGEVDPKTLAGAADMTAELLTKGTRTRSASKIAQEIEFLGASIESDANWDYSSVAVRAMSDKIDKALAIVADAALNPTFAQAEIDRYKKQLLDELEVNLKEPATLAGYVANRLAFGENGYGHPLAGTPESIKRIARINLINLHRKHYRPDNSVLIFAGDIAPETAFTIADKNFGNWAKPAAKLVSPIEQLLRSHATIVPVQTRQPSGEQRLSRKPIGRIVVVDLPDAGQAAVFVAVPGMSRTELKYFHGLVANTVFGGGYSARLNQEIRIKRGLSYGAGSNLLAHKEAGIFVARTQTKNESAAEVADVILTEITRLGIQLPAAEELSARKLTLIGDFGRELETTNGLVNQIGALALYDLPLSEINSYIQNVQRISAADIKTVADYPFSTDEANVVIVGDAKKFLPDLEKKISAGVIELSVNENGKPGKIEIIPASELDLNRPDLRKAKTAGAAKQF